MREVSNRSREGLSGRHRYAAAASLSAGLIAADQISKYLVVKSLWPGQLVEVIPRFFNLTLSHNAGGAFSLLADRPLLFTVLSVVAVALLCYLFTRLEGRTASSFAAAAIFAGAVGNLSDRFRLGYVVDFVDLHVGPWHWYVFNVADAAITVGAISLFVLTFIDERRKAPKGGEEPEGEQAENG
jgi:signal peptidase II